MSETLHDLAAAYALDALDPQERLAFERHYSACDVCVRDVRQHLETAAVLVEGSSVVPTIDLRGRVMDDISVTPQITSVAQEETIDLDEPPPLRFVRPAYVLLVAAAAVAVFAGTLGVLGFRQPGPFESVVASADAEVADLVSTSAQPPATQMAIAFSAERKQVAISAMNLPEPGVGRVYQLWLLADQGPVGVGLFRPRDGSVRGVLDVSEPEHIGWAVTIEPTGGSVSPTTPVLFQA